MKKFLITVLGLIPYVLLLVGLFVTNTSKEYAPFMLGAGAILFVYLYLIGEK